MANIDFTQPENRVLGKILQLQAQQQPDGIFLRAGELAFSYSDTLAEAKAYAAGMAAMGITKGDRVCLFMASCPEFVFLSLACNLLGAHWVPVNTDYRGSWLAETITDSRAKLLVADAEHAAHLSDMETPPLCIKGEASLAALHANSNALTLPELDYGNTASIMWTSGTTGRSKGVMQSHNAWVRAALSSAEMGGMRRGDVVYCCLPLYNSAAWVAMIYPALVSGCTVAMDPQFSASDFWDRVRYYGADHLFTLGAMHIFLWQAPESERDLDNPARSAQMIPMPEALLPGFKARFGIDAIHQGFGQSEIMLLMRRPDDGTPWPANSLGTPADDVDVALLDDEGQPVAAGEPGEICVREKAPHVHFNGYFENAEANAAAFIDGWYHTGDLAKRDEEGHYYFVDRKKDVIRYKGRNVSSVAVEAIARSHPAVSDVAVFGIPSEALASEHEIMLALVLAEGETASPEDIARHINQNAPYFFVPRYIEIMQSLPMTPTQKVRKVELRERGLSLDTWDAQQAGFKVER